MARLDLEYTDALAEVKSRIATVNLSDAQIGRRLNWAVQEISNIFHVESLLRLLSITVSSTTGMSSLESPDEWLDADIVSATWHDTGYKMELLTTGQYANWNATQNSGDPRYFIRLATYNSDPEAILPFIQVFPTPAADGDVDLLLRMAPELWETGKYCVLPSRFHRAIILGASYMCLSDLSEDEKAGIVKKQYEQALQTIRDREAEEFIHTSQGVAVVR